MEWIVRNSGRPSDIRLTRYLRIILDFIPQGSPQLAYILFLSSERLRISDDDDAETGHHVRVRHKVVLSER